MKAPTSLVNRPGRAAATVGAVLAVSASATAAFVATAAADEPGRCIENVNVREQPDVGSRIVALCEAGTAVQIGETRDGFVHLTNLGGWSAQQYVAVDGHAPAAPPAAEPGTEPGADAAEAPDASNWSGSGTGTDADPGSGSSSGSGDASVPDDEPAGDETGDDTVDGTGHDTESGGGLGGLIG